MAGQSGAPPPPAEERGDGQEEDASQRTGEPQQAVEGGAGVGRSVEEERQALTRAWALKAAQEEEVVVPRKDAEDHPPPYDTHHLPAGSANPLTKQVSAAACSSILTNLSVLPGPRCGGASNSNLSVLWLPTSAWRNLDVVAGAYLVVSARFLCEFLRLGNS